MTFSDRDSLETLHSALFSDGRPVLGWTARAEQAFDWRNVQRKRLLVWALAALVNHD
jgi:hypothetical protein